jgi:hypothetical protein
MIKKVLLICFFIFSCGSKENFRRDVSKEEKLPSINIDKNIYNCESELCYIQKVNTSNEETNTYQNNFDIAVIDTSLITNEDISLSPYIKFKIENLKLNYINEISYIYEKQDYFGNTVNKTEKKSLAKELDFYKIPIHTNIMGSGILNVSPNEKNLIHIKVIDVNGSIFIKTFEFKLMSFLNKAIEIERNPNLIHENYYSFENPFSNEKQLIESIKITNLLNEKILINSDVELLNHTHAIVSKVNKNNNYSLIVQETQFFPYNIYKWQVTEEVEKNILVKAFGIYEIEILRSNEESEELPIELKEENGISILSFKNLYLNENEEVFLNIYSYFDINNNIVGPKETKTFYTGTSRQKEFNRLNECISYSHSTNYGCDSMGCNIAIMSIDLAFLTSNVEKTYPNCDFTSSSQTLFKATEEKYNLNLIGRSHKSQISYKTDVFLNDFNELSPIYNTYKTMPILQSETGSTNFDEQSVHIGLIP